MVCRILPRLGQSDSVRIEPVCDTVGPKWDHIGPRSDPQLLEPVLNPVRFRIVRKVVSKSGRRLAKSCLANILIRFQLASPALVDIRTQIRPIWRSSGKSGKLMEVAPSRREEAFVQRCGNLEVGAQPPVRRGSIWQARHLSAAACSAAAGTLARIARAVSRTPRLAAWMYIFCVARACICSVLLVGVLVFCMSELLRRPVLATPLLVGGVL